MHGNAARALDPLFPGLREEVVEGYRNAPPTMVAEVLGGELVLHPRPRRRHGTAASRLGGRLAPFDDPGANDPGGWVILDEPELHLGARPDIVVPDLAGWRRERITDGFLDEDDGLALPPDWVCEVLSPSTEATDRGRKMDVYLRESVGHAWLVSPAARTLEVFRSTGAGWLRVTAYEGDAKVRAEPFGAVELDLARLWSI